MTIAEGLRIGDMYPDLSSVSRKLFPTSTCERVPIGDYKSSLEMRGRLTPAVQEAIGKAEVLRSKTQAVVYIAGGLTGVDEKTKERYGQVSGMLAKYGDMETRKGRKDIFFGYVPHLHGTDPVKHPNVTADEVRDIDHLWAVVVADGHVNFLNPVAHGNAIELGWAADHMIPSLGQNTRGNRLSRLTLGMENISTLMEYYNFEDDGVAQLKTGFDEFATWLTVFPDKDPREFHYRSPRVLRGPALIEKGLDPSRFHPVFDIGQFMVYIDDPQNEHYGDYGPITSHDWKESGEVGVSLQKSGKEVTFDDTFAPFSYWLI